MSYYKNTRKNYGQLPQNIHMTPYITEIDSPSEVFQSNYVNSLKTEKRRKVTFESERSESPFEFKNSLTSSDLSSHQIHRPQTAPTRTFKQASLINLNQNNRYKPMNNQQAKNPDPIIKRFDGKNYNTHHRQSFVNQTHFYQNQTIQKPEVHNIKNKRFRHKFCDENDDDESLLVILTGVNIIDNKNPKLMKKSLDRLFKYIDNYLYN
jgi:hypothetical protein